MQQFYFIYKKKKKKIDSVRTIRPNCNYVYFVYYYTNVCNLTLIDIFFFKT